MEIMRDRTTSVNPPMDPGRPDDRMSLLFDVWLVARAATDLLDRAIAPAGLDADEFAVYSLLISGETVTPSVLARWMAAPPTTVSSYLKRFEGRGHVRREPNPDDGRSYRIVLTAAGRRAHARAAALFLPAMADVTAALDRPEADLRASLASIRRALDTIRHPGAPA